MNPGDDPDVSLIVVNFEGEATVVACLESLLADAAPSRELIVVDNASRDRSASLIEGFVAGRPDTRLVRSDENLGYAGAVNLALSECRGRYVMVLNMDLVAEPGWLAPLVDELDRSPGVAAVNPLLLLMDGERTNAAGQWVHVTGLGFNRELGRRRNEIGEEPFEIAGLNGAAFLIRKSLLIEMHGMDAGGFLYHEDVNLSWLLRLMGFELRCVPRSALRHDYFLSMHAEKLYLLERNRLALIAAYLEPTTKWKIAPWLVLTEIMLWGYSLLRGPDFLAAKARAYGYLRREGERIRERRALAQSLRKQGDAAAMAPMSRRYPLAQLRTLAGERGTPRRQLG